MERADIIKLLNEQLDAMGYTDNIAVPYGRISIEVQFENEKVTLRVKERDMEKTITINKR